MTKQTNLPPMKALLYHDPPMILVDRVVEAGPEHSKCEIDINDHTMLIEEPGVPGFVGIEYMAQTIGALAGYQTYRDGKPPEIGFLLGGPKIEIHCDYFKRDTTLLATAKKIWGDETMFQFECTIHDKDTGELLCEARLNTYRPVDGTIPT